MSFNALTTHIYRYYYVYHSVRLTGNAINPSFVIYYASRKSNSFNDLHHTLHLLWNHVFFHMKLFYKIHTVFYKIQLAQFVGMFHKIHQFMHQTYRKLFYKILSPIVTASQAEGLVS